MNRVQTLHLNSSEIIKHRSIYVLRRTVETVIVCILCMYYLCIRQIHLEKYVYKNPSDWQFVCIHMLECIVSLRSVWIVLVKANFHLNSMDNSIQSAKHPTWCMYAPKEKSTRIKFKIMYINIFLNCDSLHRYIVKTAKFFVFCCAIFQQYG